MLIFILLQILGPNTILWFSARYLIYLNSALDPLIYGITNEKFRKAFRTTPIMKYFFKTRKQAQIKKPSVCIIKPIKPTAPPEWKCDKWLHLNDSSSSGKHMNDFSGNGSKNNLIK